MVQPPEEGREEAKTGSGDERGEEEEEDCTVSPAQETPLSSDTASPDTESPVMINTDVCLILLIKHLLFVHLEWFLKHIFKKCIPFLFDFL